MKDVFYLGVDYLDINAYAVYLNLLGDDYHKLMFSFWEFPFYHQENMPIASISSCFNFNENSVTKGLQTFYQLDKQVIKLKSLDELYHRIDSAKQLHRPMLWVTDSKILPYHWTYQNEETNHAHMVIALEHRQGGIEIMDPGWVDDSFILDKSELNNSVNHYQVALKPIESGEKKELNIMRVISYLVENCEGEHTTMFERMREFNQCILNDFQPEREIMPYNNDRQGIWRNPLIRNLNEIAKYRFHLAEAFSFVWREERDDLANQIARQFMEASKQWNTLKFMFSHILMKKALSKDNRKKLNMMGTTILTTEKKIAENLSSIKKV